MINFHGGKFRPIALMKCAARPLLALVLALAPLTAAGQGSDDLFRGTWQIQTPEKGALVIILKSQGLASYFWGDNSDRSVYQGSWASSETSATMTWSDGSSHVIERTDGGFSATHKGAAGNSLYNSPAMQLPQEMLGQWAKPPTREDEMRSDRENATGYFGIWKLADSNDYLFIESDRSAASNIGDANGQRGEWAKQGSELHIIWDSGQYAILSETERGFNFKQIEAGKIIEEDETETVSAARTIESSVPATWLANYKAERESDSGGIAFSSRKLARDFYRGDWVVRRGEKTYERMELARFGGLSTSTDRSLNGQWRLSGQDVFMRWDNGMRKILSPVGRGFVLYEYKPGRPLDGVPTRVLAAAPADTAKLVEHLEGRENVAAQMQEMAQAAGIESVAQDDAGWGRTFARWAWPFAGEDDAMSSEEMLAEEFEPEDAKDPWWWPFWSENPQKDSEVEETVSGDAATEAEEEETEPEAVEETTEKVEEAPVPVEMVEVETAENNASTEAVADEEAPSPENPPKRRSSKDWLWPF